MTQAMHLAELNVGRLLAPTDDPRVADFMAALDRVNGMGKRMPGFVWMMEGSGEPGKGNTGAVVWKADEGLPDIASPAANDEFVFLAASSGMVT